MGTPDPQQSQMTEALDRLWRQHLPTLEERVAVLENAARILGKRDLTDDERAAANSAAHKLAGVLGTFGLTSGTVLAREAEILCSGNPDTSPAVTKQLAKIAAQLKAMIADRRLERSGTESRQQLHSKG